MACRGLRRAAASSTADALASSTKETFHTVEIADILAPRLLCLALAVVNFLM